MIDTSVPGTTTAVGALASWLRDSLKKAVADSADDVDRARKLANDQWAGESGNAYVRCAADVIRLTDDYEERIKRAADKIDDYKARLGTCEARMSGFRQEARDGGLVVDGVTIHPPEDLTDEDQVNLYNKLVTDVGDEWTNFQEWIDANLKPVEATLDPSLTEKLLEELQGAAGNFAIAYGLETGKRKLQQKATDLKSQADELHRWRRSGNPARRAANAQARQSGLIDELGERSTWLGRASKVLGPLGTVYEGYVALESDTPAGGLLATGAGLAATAGVVAVVATAPVSVPAGLVVLGATAVGVGVSWAVTEGWDALPDSFTDPIDDAVEDAWNDTKDAVSDGWDAVTGWI